VTTYYVTFNCQRGALRDAGLRRSLVRAVDVSGSFDARSEGSRSRPTASPSGLLGYSAAGPGSGPGRGVSGSPDSSVEATVSRETIELTAGVHPVFFGEFSAYFRELTAAFREIGFRIRPVNKTMEEYSALQLTGDGDLNIGRWNADYPDADNFVHTLLHSDSGFLGRYLRSPELDALAERGRVETDPRVRHSIYRRVEELIAREALLLPLFNDQTYCFARPEVEGLSSVSQGNPIVEYENLSIRR
jgi:peptide/nickel transport system substrate-binding protein